MSDNQTTAPAVVPASKGVPRYPPWLQKALTVKEETERFWLQQQREQQQLLQRQRPTSRARHSVRSAAIQSISKHEREEADAKATDEDAGVSVWESIAVDDVMAVKSFLEGDKHRFLLRRDLLSNPNKGIMGGGGGESLLHEASYNGALRVTRYLIAFMEAHFTTEACREALNAVDTQYSQTTPVLATCRSSSGSIVDRVDILRLLVQAGADTTRRDAHGDNALHWCARTSQVVLIRYLLKETDAGAVALSVENYKRQTPLVIAKRQLELKSCLSTLTVYELLASVERECSMRLKMQVLKRHEALAQAESAAQEQEQLAAALETADLLLSKADRQWRDTLEIAEKKRQAAEQEYADAAMLAAAAAAREWLESKDGKLFVKKQMPLAMADIKQAVHSGKMVKPKDPKKAATQRVQDLYCREKEQTARKEAADRFYAARPPYPRERAAELRRILHL